MASQAEKDTARAKSRQNGGDGGTAKRMAEREASAGLNLAGNNTTSGRGLADPTFSQREANAGLNLAGNSTTSSRDDFYSFKPSRVQRDAEVDSGLYDLPPPVIFDTPAERELKEKSPLYAFKVVNDGDGTVSVTTGTVNTSTATGLTPSGKPTVLWLKVTFDTSGSVTAAIVATTPGATSATNDARQIASITWDGDTPTIVQGIKGSQSIASCGATHQWGTLYS